MPDSFSEMRRRNAVRVLELIRQNGELSRAEIARLTDLSKATVSSIATELLESDLVSETGVLSTQKGRKPTGLVFNPAARFSCGLSIDDQSKTSLAVVNMDGSILLEETGISLEWTTPSVVDFLTRAFAKRGLQTDRLCSLGMSVPGPVRGERSKVYFALKDELVSRFQINVELGSLVDMAAVAEASVEKPAEDTLGLFVRTSHGLRGTLLSGSSLLKIHAEVGGDLGHILAPWIQETCACGNVGCVNAYVGSESLIRRAKERGLNINSVTELTEKARNDSDDTARNLLADAGLATGYAIAAMMNAFAPLTVIVAGTLVDSGDGFWGALEAGCRKYAGEENFKACRLKRSVLGTHSHCVGAARAALLHASVFKD